MQDFAEGTSSRSTKLVRWDATGRLSTSGLLPILLVNAVVQGIAPHIPRPTPMLLPIYDEPEATYDMSC